MINFASSMLRLALLVRLLIWPCLGAGPFTVVAWPRGKGQAGTEILPVVAAWLIAELFMAAGVLCAYHYFDAKGRERISLWTLILGAAGLWGFRHAWKVFVHV